MRTLKIVLILLVGFLSFNTVIAQSTTVNQIAVALKNGDANSLGNHLAPNVSLGLEGKEQSYSRAQAIQVLRSFFSKNSTKDFTYKHSARSQQKDQFYVGGLTTSKGDFRVTYFLIKAPKGPVIKRLRLEPK